MFSFFSNLFIISLVICVQTLPTIIKLLKCLKLRFSMSPINVLFYSSDGSYNFRCWPLHLKTNKSAIQTAVKMTLLSDVARSCANLWVHRDKGLSVDASTWHSSFQETWLLNKELVNLLQMVCIKLLMEQLHCFWLMCCGCQPGGREIEMRSDPYNAVGFSGALLKLVQF